MISIGPVHSHFKGIWVVFFTFIRMFIRAMNNSGDPDHTPHFLASDLNLHCLSKSHKKDAHNAVYIWLNLVGSRY